MDISFAEVNPGSIPVARGQTLRIAGRPGRVVHCVSGQVWLTQYDVSEDYFLPGGTSYRSRGGGLILVNSCQDLSVISVRDHAGDAGAAAGPVRIESLATLDLEARGRRASAFAGIVRRGRAALAGWWRRRAHALERAG